MTTDPFIVPAAAEAMHHHHHHHHHTSQKQQQHGHSQSTAMTSHDHKHLHKLDRLDNNNNELDDELDDYLFASTYRPLSNLPTPPPSSRNSTAFHSPTLGHNEALEESLLGPAIHLVNMLPPNASLANPSVPLVQAMLTRAQLPLDTIALAVCILDSLDVRFSRKWRLTCPLGDQVSRKKHTPSYSVPAASYVPMTSHAPSASTSTFMTSSSTSSPSLHIDSVYPELIILAALVIAAKFNEDGHVGQQSAEAYCQAWAPESVAGAAGVAPETTSSSSLWTGAQLASTERCIVKSLNYRIFPLADEDLLADARADMDRAGANARRGLY